MYDATRKRMASVPPFSFLVNQTYVLANGYPIVVAPHFRMRTGSGIPNMFTYVYENPLLFWTHTLPIFPWAVFAPLQMSTYVRENYPAIRRWTGRLVLLCSVRLSMSSRGELRLPTP